MQGLRRPLHGQLEGRLLTCLLSSVLLLPAAQCGSTVLEPCTADACASPTGSQTTAPVLLQKAVTNQRSFHSDEEESVATAPPQQSPESAKATANGFAAGMGLLNPLLETTEIEYQDSQSSAGKVTSFGQLFNASEEAEVPSKGNAISKVAQTDLLGDALEPTNHGEGIKDQGHHEHFHGYIALLFLFGGLTIGSLILILHERFLPQLPYTCLLFIAGFFIAAIHSLKAVDSWLTWGSWYDSVAMWEEINPHLLFYVFLPALVFSEAMRLNKTLVKACFGQILLLAGPGVLIGTAMMGSFSHYVLPYEWDWPICLVIGSILSATDPVAVVALFNTLGVSPRLTMVISGESLLNDGTAFVVFTLMLKVVLGASLTPGGVLMFFANMTVLSFIIGFVVASVALWIISCLALERGHSDAMVQVVITICCGYLCFFLAESELSTSGILSLVSSGFALAYSAWPRFVSKEVVHTVWEAIEFVGNTMVFLLAGLLFADSCFSRLEHILIIDLFWLLVMYFAAMAIRAVLIVILWIPLKWAGTPLSWKEGIVMVWSGLRGAVSLAMAIIVDTEPAISKKMGTRVMFHVGGIAALTLIINATTTATLLKYLGLTRDSEEREKMLEHLGSHVAERTSMAFDKLLEQSSKAASHADDIRFAGADPDVVRRLVPVLSTTPSEEPAAPVPSGSNTDESEKLAARCRAYREIFLQVVQNHYWESIEQGIIPRNNKVARILLSSKDEALSDVATCLNDWSYIVAHVDVQPPTGFWALLANIAQSRILSAIPALPQSVPSAEVIETWKIYAVLSFQEAHKCAREEVPGFFDLSDDSKVKEIVAEESQKRCEEAGQLLKTVEPSAVSFGKSRMLAQKLLRLQLDEVQKLQDQGVLKPSETQHLDHSIHDALFQIARADYQLNKNP